MLLTVDIGNSNIKAGLFDGDLLKCRWVLATSPPRLTSWYEKTFKTLLNDAGAFELKSTIISSVAPDVTERVSEALHNITGIEPLWVGPDCAGGLRLEYDAPERLGPDRIASSLAGVRLIGTPVVVVDFGTATTLNFIHEGPVYHGGAILPGVGLMSHALKEATGMLPEIDLEADLPDDIQPAGRNTEDSILSGIIYGTVGAVRKIINETERRESCKYKVVITGGAMHHVMPYLGNVDAENVDLTLLGLKYIYETC